MWNCLGVILGNLTQKFNTAAAHCQEPLDAASASLTFLLDYHAVTRASICQLTMAAVDTIANMFPSLLLTLLGLTV